ncbi:MAG: DUF721 domain-containing protein [Armatimonadota bacterium]
MRLDNRSHTLGSLLSNMLHNSDIDRKLKEHTCLLVWDEVVGEQVSGAAQPDKVIDGMLFVMTKSPVWANELQFYKADMISKLNSRVGGTVIKDIIFKAGKIAPRKKLKKPTDISLEGIDLSDNELDSIKKTAQAAGEGASEGLEKLFETALKLEKWKKSQGWKPCSSCGALQNDPSGVCPCCQVDKY